MGNSNLFPAVQTRQEKYQVYRYSLARYAKAMKEGFFFEAILIDYAMIEDRLRSFLWHAGAFERWEDKTKFCDKEESQELKTLIEENWPGHPKCISLEKIGHKIGCVRAVTVWASESIRSPDESVFLRALRSQCEGLDAAAHQAALDAGGGTIAVLGNGLDVYYPAVNAALQDEIAQRGLLLSESPPGRHAVKGSFPMRNRILAALSRATLVTEAGEKSGALLTAELAMDCGRELFVVPGNIDSPASYATNRLLRTSAEVVLEARDVLDRLGLAAPEEKTAQEPPALDEEEQKIVQCLSREAQSFDELAVLSGFLAPKLNSLLTRLELKGIIDQSAGRVYAMKR